MPIIENNYCSISRPCSMNPSSFPIKQINNNGISTATRGMPFKSTNMTQGNTFSMSRAYYTKSFNKDDVVLNAYSKNKAIPVSSSQYISKRKAKAIGKSSLLYSGGLKYKNDNNNSVNSALSKVRGGGCVAPKKKGAV